VFLVRGVEKWRKNRQTIEKDAIDSIQYLSHPYPPSIIEAIGDKRQ
jgi:hypothetical protein